MLEITNRANDDDDPGLESLDRLLGLGSRRDLEAASRVRKFLRGRKNRTAGRSASEEAAVAALLVRLARVLLYDDPTCADSVLAPTLLDKGGNEGEKGKDDFRGTTEAPRPPAGDGFPTASAGVAEVTKAIDVTDEKPSAPRDDSDVTAMDDVPTPGCIGKGGDSDDIERRSGGNAADETDGRNIGGKIEMGKIATTLTQLPTTWSSEDTYHNPHHHSSRHYRRLCQHSNRSMDFVATDLASALLRVLPKDPHHPPLPLTSSPSSSSSSTASTSATTAADVAVYCRDALLPGGMKGNDDDCAEDPFFLSLARTVSGDDVDSSSLSSLHPPLTRRRFLEALDGLVSDASLSVESSYDLEYLWASSFGDDGGAAAIFGAAAGGDGGGDNNDDGQERPPANRSTAEKATMKFEVKVDHDKGIGDNPRPVKVTSTTVG